MLPNFLIIGAMRSATGWIRQCLNEHPNIFVARFETHFFDRNYERGLSWWEETHFSEYNGERAIGEKTATYLCDPKIPRRIINIIPEAKLICCLRDPMDRAYSHYVWWVRTKSDTKTPSFPEAATLESDFVQRSLYFKQLNWFLEEFPRERILIKIYEDKEKDSLTFIQDIFNYLGVDSEFIPPSFNLQTKRGALENVNKFWFRTSRILLNPRAPLVFKKIYKKIRPRWESPSIDEDTLINLGHFFKEDILGLEKFLKRDLGCWKSKLLGDY